MNTLAAIRPDSWNFPLLLHILGAAVLVGAVITAVVSTLTAERTPQPDVMRRIAFRSLWMVGVPAYVVMRIGAEWIYSKEFGDVEDDPAWIGIGYMTADIGLLVFLIALGLAGHRGPPEVGRARKGVGLSRRPAPHRVRRRHLGDGRQAGLGTPDEARPTRLSPPSSSPPAPSSSASWPITWYWPSSWTSTVLPFASRTSTSYAAPSSPTSDSTTVPPPVCASAAAAPAERRPGQRLVVVADTGRDRDPAGTATATTASAAMSISFSLRDIGTSSIASRPP